MGGGIFSSPSGWLCPTRRASPSFEERTSARLLLEAAEDISALEGELSESLHQEMQDSDLEGKALREHGASLALGQALLFVFCFLLFCLFAFFALVS